MVRTGLFGCRNFVDTFSDISYSTHIIIHHCSRAYKQNNSIQNTFICILTYLIRI
ncbi:CTP synthase [Gossypium arboreum]|uniref:CTP synthase n=1 Tax=Gossypium arboreum TaxID=29729 RepID=A0A0B0NGR9_GOSAR|nr:CTP synthase [Gossypium arboreum]